MIIEIQNQITERIGINKCFFLLESVMCINESATSLIREGSAFSLYSESTGCIKLIVGYKINKVFSRFFYKILQSNMTLKLKISAMHQQHLPNHYTNLSNIYSSLQYYYDRPIGVLFQYHYSSPSTSIYKTYAGTYVGLAFS